MPRQAKPIHVFQQVRCVTKNPLYPKLAVLDYWNGKRRTEIPLVGILRIECDCEEMLVTVKSDRIRTFSKRINKIKDLKGGKDGVVSS